MSELEDFKKELENIEDVIDQARDMVFNTSNNFDKEVIYKCKGYFESIEGCLNDADDDIQQAKILLYGEI